MPIKTGTLFPPDRRANIPGMSKHDLSLWLRFLELRAHTFEGFYYNVRVSTGTPAPLGLTEEQLEMVFDVNANRIDAVGKTDTGITIFEIRPEAGLGAIGSIVGGEILWKIERETLTPVKRALVTDFLKPSIKAITDWLEIETWVV